MAEFVFVNTIGTHFKVWGYDLYKNHKTGESNVITFWGRIGLPMYRLTKRNKWFKTYSEAYDYVMQKLKEKRSKHYKAIKNHAYFSLIDDKNTNLAGIITLIDEANTYNF